jgi:DNA invertase Pin-like site-specific DNA recombinase
MGRTIGYARVSTTAQDLEVQIEALRAAGCSRIFHDKLSGRTAERPGLKRLQREVEAGDVVLVYKVDRMARSLRDLLNLLFEFRERGVGFRSLNDPIMIDGPVPDDPVAAAMAEAQVQMLGLFAQLERAFIVGRTSAGRAIARRKGVRFGRKPKLTTEQVEQARDLIESGRHTVSSVAQSLHVDRTTLWRHLQRHARVQKGEAPEDGSSEFGPTA